jgi:hypothetical protein
VESRSWRHMESGSRRYIVHRPLQSSYTRGMEHDGGCDSGSRRYIVHCPLLTLGEWSTMEAAAWGMDTKMKVER